LVVEQLELLPQAQVEVLVVHEYPNLHLLLFHSLTVYKENLHKEINSI
jgi:hypothetical protein